MNFRNKPIFYVEELLAPYPTPKLEDRPLSGVRDCLLNIFAAPLHIWRPSPPSATWGRAMPWWQGTIKCKKVDKVQIRQVAKLKDDIHAKDNIICPLT
jgi:hypothetical protein